MRPSSKFLFVQARSKVTNPDAKPYFEMNITDASSSSSPGLYFHKDFFVLLNLAVGGHFTGISDINKVTALNDSPAHMYVDYVKVYQKKS